MSSARVVFLAVDAASPRCTVDDRLLVEAIEARGVEAVPVVWGGDLPAGSIVVIRSTWDYVERPTRFAAWLDELAANEVVLHNPLPLLRWNMNKRYLLDLAGCGVPTVPTQVVPAGTHADLSALRQDRGWDDVVVKPAVGGTARLAAQSRRVDPDALQRHLDTIAATEDAIVQPYLESVVNDGEVSIVVIAGEPMLAVEKRAAPGDWRVQAEFGGTAVAMPLTAQLSDLATTVLDALGTTPSYARVDVTGDPRNHLVLELELIEPELFFRLDPAVAARLARHLTLA